MNNAVTKIKSKKLLWQFLSEYVSEKRKALFDHALAYRTRHIVLVAEDTYKEHNASALIRTCDCFGIQEMHLIEKEHHGKIAPGMTKGAEKWVDTVVHQASNLNTSYCLDQLKAKGYRIVATSPHTKSTTPAQISLVKPIALFFGREKEGLSTEILENADEHLTVPMYGFSESYNVSVTAALVLQQIMHRLHNSDINWQLSENDRLDLKIKWAFKSIAKGELLLQEMIRQNPKIPELIT
ncbi:MAG TPA: rRNA methyltransferase [Cytophagales bacterium]|nr:rRNA methyltransferase [Cytophagales bacterium]